MNSAKFARALVSEIIAIDAVRGMRTSSRIDPLGIRSIPGIIYKTNAEQWTLEAEKAAKMGGKPLLYGKEGSKLGTPPTINHGNILPTTNRTSARCLNGSPFAAC